MLIIAQIPNHAHVVNTKYKVTYKHAYTCMAAIISCISQLTLAKYTYTKSVRVIMLARKPITHRSLKKFMHLKSWKATKCQHKQ